VEPLQAELTLILTDLQYQTEVKSATPKITDLILLSRVTVTKARVWIGEPVYCIFTSRDYN
jgi:hypothetical protein